MKTKHQFRCNCARANCNLHEDSPCMNTAEYGTHIRGTHVIVAMCADCSDEAFDNETIDYRDQIQID